MKKNKMMRLASTLLVAVLITTSTISGTYAKYVTDGETYDKARVAKFGVTVTSIVDDGTAEKENTMFKNEYDNGVDVTVKASEDVVAPGTSGVMTGFTVKGTPEVAVEVDYKDANLELENWTVDGNFYCPLIFTVTVKGTPISIYGTEYTTAERLEIAVENTVKSATAKYWPGDNLANVDTDLKVEWSWPFEVGTEDVLKANDAKDTALGDAAAVGTAATVTFSATCTVTQID